MTVDRGCCGDGDTNFKPASLFGLVQVHVINNKLHIGDGQNRSAVLQVRSKFG